MADLSIPKPGQKPHPMQKHLDAIKENHDRLNDFFKGQMEQQFKADADQDRQAKAGSGASPLGGQAK